jgi:hypothetical protein
MVGFGNDEMEFDLLNKLVNYSHIYGVKSRFFKSLIDTNALGLALSSTISSTTKNR